MLNVLYLLPDGEMDAIVLPKICILVLCYQWLEFLVGVEDCNTLRCSGKVGEWRARAETISGEKITHKRGVLANLWVSRTTTIYYCVGFAMSWITEANSRHRKPFVFSTANSLFDIMFRLSWPQLTELNDILSKPDEAQHKITLSY